jgi:hypothetical protein
VIRLGQMRCKKSHGRKMNTALREQLENDRKSARRARDLDAVVRSMLGQVKDVSAVGDHRRTTLTKVQPASVEFGKRTHERTGAVAVSTRLAAMKYFQALFTNDPCVNSHSQ